MHVPYVCAGGHVCVINVLSFKQETGGLLNY